LDLLNAAALLRQNGHRATLLDGRARRVSRLEMIQAAHRADLVLLQTSALDRWQCPDLDLKALEPMTRGLPRDRLVVAGAHGTMWPRYVLERTGAGALILGEPEETLAELAERGGDSKGVAGTARLDRGNLVVEPARPPLQLDAGPPPAYDRLDWSGYRDGLMGPSMGVLETSRGCPFRCGFCLKTMYGPGYRTKSVDRVYREAALVKASGGRSVYFIDLEFTLDRRRTLDLCRALEPLALPWCCQTRVDQVDPEMLAAMAKAGCRLVHFGIESGAPEVLARTGKGITLAQARSAILRSRRSGIRTAAFFLFGLPGETETDRRRTIRAALDLDPDWASFHVAAPYPGTLLGRERGAASGTEPEEGNSAPPALVVRAVRRGWLRFYLRFTPLARALFSSGPAGLARQGALWWDFFR
jgi:radical SAM superfamily enzyme YgiQ (UPF0313 family)